MQFMLSGLRKSLVPLFVVVVVCITACAGKSEQEQNVPVAAAHFLLEEWDGTAFQEAIMGCQEVLRPDQQLGGPQASFGKNPSAEGGGGGLNVDNITDGKSLTSRVMDGPTVLAEKTYTLEFLQSGQRDTFEVKTSTNTFRLSYWGAANCETM
ncbi:MAG: hypothetical protein SFV15_01570 [Polyangiaceae bacterium]|nr:hypothetical protein [Polyangiaceae bacterium]